MALWSRGACPFPLSEHDNKTETKHSGPPTNGLNSSGKFSETRPEQQGKKLKLFRRPTTQPRRHIGAQAPGDIGKRNSIGNGRRPIGADRRGVAIERGPHPQLTRIVGKGIRHTHGGRNPLAPMVSHRDGLYGLPLTPLVDVPPAL